MLESYVPIVVAMLFGLGFAGLFLGLGSLFGGLSRRLSTEKLSPFECGSEPIGSPRARIPIKFYQVALLFLVFDVEAAFTYPWAVLFRELSCTGTVVAGHCGGTTSWFGFVEMALFIAVLAVGLIFVARRRAIGWD